MGIVNGSDEIEALYQQVDAGDSEAPPPEDDAVPPGSFQMLFSNLSVGIDGDRAVATLLWRS